MFSIATGQTLQLAKQKCMAKGCFNVLKNDLKVNNNERGRDRGSEDYDHKLITLARTDKTPALQAKV